MSVDTLVRQRNIQDIFPESPQTAEYVTTLLLTAFGNPNETERRYASEQLATEFKHLQDAYVDPVSQNLYVDHDNANWAGTSSPETIFVCNVGQDFINYATQSINFY